jgi:hypothetical protein
MLRNVLIAITAAVLLGAISLLAAEKVKEKKAKEKEQPTQALERQRPGALLDELIAAYKANDREKMGQIIKKMEQRRGKGQKFAKFNRWHERAHQRMDMRGPGQSAFSETSPKGGQRGWSPAQREAQRSGVQFRDGVPVGGPGWGGLQRPGC